MDRRRALELDQKAATPCASATVLWAAGTGVPHQGHALSASGSLKEFMKSAHPQSQPQKGWQRPWNLYSHKRLGGFPWALGSVIPESVLCIFPDLTHHPLKDDKEESSPKQTFGIIIELCHPYLYGLRDNL